MKVAINGFGRIGRLVLRAIFENDRESELEVVAVNDLENIDTSIHLLKYDSVHGFFNEAVKKISEDKIRIGNQEVNYYSKRNPQDLPWENLGVDLVMECTGVFKTEEACSLHLEAGAKKVLLSCPGKDLKKIVIFGVNDDTLNKEDKIVSSGSCTTNCLAPIVKILDSEFGIDKGFASTIHSYTGDQNIVDKGHRDLRRARAAAVNIIPTTTGAAKSIEKIFPKLKGKLQGAAYRVPTPNVSLVDCNFSLKKSTTLEQLKEIIIKWADFKFKPDVLGYTCEGLVSSDFNHSPYSSIVDLSLVKVIDGNFVNIVSWYDNEWGFSNRMIDNACLML
ncbi:MAG: type I glyceraldehyde-3-phosphate dehydrogenase [Alphaproteobacteria bacterium]|nr:type I glyceraldehyde-3-phosphate dehydrogenase [Alphaproteobacteria bacterium]